MQIQLKQREIEAALKMYVSQQGINLTNKTVEVVFTSGRKDNGISAELTIEDAAVPAIPTGLINRSFEAAVTTPPDVIEATTSDEAAPDKPVSLFA